jgi:starch synthase
MLTTVSPTYAREIQTPQFGSGLDGLLRDRQADLRGIVNGIDPAVWSPSREPMLIERYDSATVAVGKAKCKAWLQRRAGLPQRPDVPLFAQIGRLDPQKGWDLLAEISERLLALDVQVIVLGVGNRNYHELLDALARRHGSHFRAFLDFSDELAHQIEAGADIFLMPSLFEPCGLNQLYSLAHGTVPIVHSVGGLADTVVDTNPQTLANRSANGFVFRHPSADALWQAIDRALTLWSDRDAWRQLIHTGMTTDWSWDSSAAEYAKVYSEIYSKHHLPTPI